MVSTHPGGAQEIPGLDPGWSTQLLRIAQQLEAILADHGGLSGLSDPDHDHGTSLTAASLLDDDHTQYALLAGRGTGQTLNGGLNAGNDLTLLGTAHATAGSVIIQSSSIFEMDGATGQLKLPTTGSSAGLLIGGDVQLYRGAADVWITPDSVRVGGYLNAGSASAPSNTTAGDVTGLRGHFGTDAAFTSGMSFEVNAARGRFGGELTATGVILTNAISPASDGNFYQLQVSPTFTPSVDITNNLIGVAIFPTFTPGAGIDLTSIMGVQMALITGSSTGTITNAYGLYANVAYGSQKPTNARGIYVLDWGSAGITLASGIRIDLPTGSTTNYYMELNTATADVNVAIGSNVSIPVIIGGVARKIYAT